MYEADAKSSQEPKKPHRWISQKERETSLRDGWNMRIPTRITYIFKIYDELNHNEA
jgi:hypothetical protein